ncbi:hypothetical protein SAMN05192529_13126 [Arachidicoccus rhizosphaerae]|uniref:Uncharacterized protein n=1 Tax=Arachidicoccus rhizosphaerae TaxID=551991 RepID=A0A1H4CFK9_9BACT|nr:hypothetical protein [Arachidicoccus rhizosphaerae]SEA59120.1 hypothetical protein SAMN05192529_13126 [Arachidicoccus rhizosphaerae]
MASKNNKVDGSVLVLLGKRVGDSNWLPILCQTELSLGRQLNTIDASSKCGKDIAIDEEDGTVTMTGFMIKANVTDVMTTKDLEDLYKTKDEADYMIGVVNPTDQAGLTTYRFSGIITAKNLDMNNNEKGKASITITTTGTVETGVILPTGLIMWDSDAKATGYTFDWAVFFNTLNEDIPQINQQEAELLFAPGISKTGYVAGINKLGKLVEINTTRAGTATYIGSDGYLKTAATDVPRFDYSTGVARHLIETAATNLFPYSNLNSSTYLSISMPSGEIAYNAEIGRDGKTMNAPRFSCVSSQGCWIYNNTGIPVTEGSTYVLSFWVKAISKLSGYSWEFRDAATLVAISSGDYSSQVKIGKFVKIEQTVTIPTGTTLLRLYVYKEASSTSGSFSITDVQLELGTVSTSTIVTSGAVATRAADIVKSANDVVPYSAATVYMDAIVKNISGSSYRYLSKAASANTLMYTVTNDTRAIYPGTTYAIVANTNNKRMSFWNASTVNVGNGGAIGSPIANDGSLPGSGQLRIGTDGPGGISMQVKCLAIFSRKFTDTEVQTLTK